VWTRFLYKHGITGLFRYLAKHAVTVEHRCPYLVTYNMRDYQLGHEDVTVVEPGTLVRRMLKRIRGLA